MPVEHNCRHEALAFDESSYRQLLPRVDAQERLEHQQLVSCASVGSSSQFRRRFGLAVRSDATLEFSRLAIDLSGLSQAEPSGGIS
jgi:hypothetical protein